MGLNDFFLGKAWNWIFNRPKINIDIGRQGIINKYLDQEGKQGFSEVEVLMQISNSGNKAIGISKVLIESKNKNYWISSSCYEYKNEWKNHPISSFKLEPEETKDIILYSKYNLMSIEKEFIEAEIKIYNTKYKVIKSIPIRLYIGSVYGYSIEEEKG